MTPVQQTKFNQVVEVEHGNQFEACLASLLDLPLSAIPLFDMAGQDWFYRLSAFLPSRSYEIRGVFYFAGPHEWTALLEISKGVDGHFICMGDTLQGYSTRGHTVIYKDDVLVHDPHPARQGLRVREMAYLIQRKE